MEIEQQLIFPDCNIDEVALRTSSCSLYVWRQLLGCGPAHCTALSAQRSLHSALCTALAVPCTFWPLACCSNQVFKCGKPAGRKVFVFVLFFPEFFSNSTPFSNFKTCIILQMPWSLIQYRVNGSVIVTSPCGYSTNLTFLFRSERVWLYGSVSLQEMRKAQQSMAWGLRSCFLSWLVLLSNGVLFQSSAYVQSVSVFERTIKIREMLVETCKFRNQGEMS